MVDVALSDRIVTLTPTQLASMPVELVMAKTVGTMAALLQLDITSQAAAISKQNTLVQKLTVFLSKCRELSNSNASFNSIAASSAPSPFSDKTYAQLKADISSLIPNFNSGVSSQSDWQNNISLVESALDNANTLSQDQNVRIQSLKDKYDQMYKIISGFESSSKEVAMGIIQKIG